LRKRIIQPATALPYFFLGEFYGIISWAPNDSGHQRKGDPAMRKKDIIRAWKDEDFREHLSEAEAALVPANPAGLIELADSDLAYAVTGGFVADTASAGSTASRGCFCVITLTSNSSGSVCACSC
jgi:mersacidin/lichenicidin family type 2 lantibiotic